MICQWKLGAICMTFQMNQPYEILTSCKSINVYCISLGHMAPPGVKWLIDYQQIFITDQNRWLSDATVKLDTSFDDSWRIFHICFYQIIHACIPLKRNTWLYYQSFNFRISYSDYTIHEFAIQPWLMQHQQNSRLARNAMFISCIPFWLLSV